MKYYVKCVKNSISELVQFSSKKKMEKFIENFVVYNEGYWIDFSFSSDDLEILDESVKVKRVK